MGKLNLASLLRTETAIEKFLEMSKRDMPEGYEKVLTQDAERVAAEARRMNRKDDK
jgi:seryl-tRNA(Sec) selenium transferase